MRLTWVFRILFFLILGEVFLFSTSLYAEEHQIKKFQVSGKILNEEVDSRWKSRQLLFQIPYGQLRMQKVIL